MLRIHALGGLSVCVDGDAVPIGGPRQRRLLAVLLLHRDRVVSVDRVAEAVFAGEPTDAAATTLRSYVARLRRVLGDDPSVRLTTEAPGYRIAVVDDAFDVACFDRLVTRASRRSTSGDPAEVADLLRTALGMWRGDAYAEFADEEWARTEALRLSEQRLVAHEMLFDAELRSGRATEIVAEIEAVASAHPLREAVRGQLMLALYRAGRHADALRAYADHRHVLLDELGLDPGPAIQELERRILDHDPTLASADPGGTVIRGYTLGDRVGTDSESTVFTAGQAGSDEVLAMRVVRDDVADRPSFVRTFESRARRVNALDHPAIVTPRDYWREPGAAFVVSRRLPGGTLAARRASRELTVEEIADLVRRIGGALSAAHAADVPHGRVGPTTVLFDEHGRAALADFALDGDDPDVTADADVAALCRLVTSAGPDLPPDARDVIERALACDRPPPVDELVSGLVAALDEQHSSIAPRTNPYKGLHAFGESDAADYFGRDAAVDEVLGRLGGDGITSRLVLVVGGSGAGKSSVVRAGVVPRLRRGAVADSERWLIATMLPGATPFKELAECLRGLAVGDTASSAAELASTPEAIDLAARRLAPDGGDVVLIVDQLEELFTMVSADERRAFLDGILHATTTHGSRLRVIGTLRADHYDRPLASEGFGAIVHEVTVAIPPMTPTELDAAITAPAERVGRTVEGPLVAELLADLHGDSSPLPALQFTLFALADGAGTTLTLDAYRRLGGMHGAIAERAESLFQDQSAPEREQVRRMFERLVAVGADGTTTRRRIAREELVDGDPELDAAVDRWALSRLVTLDRDAATRRPTVEVAHEALLSEWPRLRTWIDESRERLTVVGALRDAAEAWHDVGRDDGALYRGRRLRRARDLLGQEPRDLAGRAAEFYAASVAAHEGELAAAAALEVRRARAHRRLRRQRVVLASALVVAVVGTLLAVGQRREAEAARRTATSRELASASTANLDDDPELSTLLALEALDATDPGDPAARSAVDALHRSVTSSRLVRHVPGIGGAVDWSARGDVFATEGPEESGLVEVRDAASGEVVWSRRGHDVDVNDVAFDGEGRLLATSGDDGRLRVWNRSTGALVLEAGDPDGGSVWGASLSGDGARVAASWLDSAEVRVLDVATGATVAELPAPAAVSTALDGNGSRVAFGANDAARATVIELSSGGRVHFGSDELWIRDVAFSPDGTTLATTGGDGTARLWDSSSGAATAVLVGHRGPVNVVDWSGDGSMVATGSDDGTARVWEAAGGTWREVSRVSARDTRNGIGGVAFGPDGTRILTGDWAVASARMWDVSSLGGAEWLNAPTELSNRVPVAFTAKGDLVVADPDGLSVWDPATRRRVANLLVRETTGGGPPADPDDLLGDLARLATAVYDATVPLESELGLLDDPSGVLVGLDGAAQGPEGDVLGATRVTVRSATRVSETEAEFVYDLFTPRRSETGRRGRAVMIGGSWRLSRDTLCADLALVGGACAAGGDVRSGGVVRFAVDTADDAVATSNGYVPVELWDLRRERHVRTIDLGTAGDAVIDMDWSPDGKHLAVVVGGARCRVAVVDRRGTQLAELSEDVDACIRTVDFAPGGGRLVTTRWPDRYDPALEGATIWDWRREAVTGTIRTSAADAVFGGDGTWLATTRQLEGVTEIWDVDGGTRLRQLTTAAPATELATSVDGRRLATAGLDGTVQVWDPAGGDLLTTLATPRHAASAVAFDGDGRRLATTGNDGVARVWALDVDDLSSIARRGLSRSLTGDECRRYLHRRCERD